MPYEKLSDQNYIQKGLRTALLDIAGKTGVKGISVAVCNEKRPVCAAATGVLSAENDSPVTVDSVFWGVQLSAPVLAYLAMQLHEKGLMDLYKPLSVYLPEPYLPQDMYLPEITAYMVLTHTAGFPDKKEKDVPLAILRKPGTLWDFSGEGLRYLQKVIEHITGQNLQDYAQEHLFRPFGMKNTAFVWQNSFQGRFAYPHKDKAVVNHYIQADKPNVANYFYTTPSDYCAFLHKLLAPPPQGKTCILPENAGKITAAQVPLFGNFAWACGMGCYKDKDWDLAWQFGDRADTKAFACIDNREKLGITVCVNDPNGMDACAAVMKELSGQSLPLFRQYFGFSPAKMLYQNKLKKS